MGIFQQIAQQKSTSPTKSDENFKSSGSQFIDRLRLSFGTEEDLARQQEIETAAGKKGRFDLGDIADVAGGALPLIGGVVGGVAGAPAGGVGAVPGAAIGAAAGQSVKQTVGHMLGVRRESSPTHEVAGPVGEAAMQLVGGKAVQGVAKIPGVKGSLAYVTKTIPERLYNIFYKSTAEDIGKLVDTKALEAIRTESPELFKKMVDEGIIQKSMIKNGKIEINPTLAQEALERGVQGDLMKMATYHSMKNRELEIAAREAAKKTNRLVDLGKRGVKGYIDILKSLEDAYIDTPGGSQFMKSSVSAARQLRNLLMKSPDGRITADNALVLRRVLDGLRNARSFSENAKLAPLQDIFKTAANKLRGRLAKVPGMEKIMNEYRFNIEGEDAIVQEIARTTRGKVIGLPDAVLMGGSMNNPVGLGAWATFKTMQVPTVLSWIAQTLYKAPERTMKYIVPPINEAINRNVVTPVTEDFNKQ